MASTFGRLFRTTTFGESHGPAVGAVVDGCPPGLRLDAEQLQDDMDRRRPGSGPLVSGREEADRVEILSGVHDGVTLGTPITLIVRNADARPGDYDDLRDIPRPGHADLTTLLKYGVRDHRGGGRAGARETVGRVAAGAVARQLLSKDPGIEVVAWVDGVGSIEAPLPDLLAVDRDFVDATAVRCPEPKAAALMQEAIEDARRQGDTVGASVTCIARGVPAGLGEPVFDKLGADVAKALMSIPAARGFEIGEGFGAVGMSGSEHNDPLRMEGGRVRGTTNRAGGTLGGISTGEIVRVRIAFKPVPTIFKPQDTVTTAGDRATFTPSGRHDPCVGPRAVPIVEAMMLLVLADHYLRQRSLRGSSASPTTDIEPS